MFGWTWAQIVAASQAVQAYHHDLAARLFTGKSPVVTEAKRAAAHRSAIDAGARELMAARPELTREDAEVLVDEAGKLKEVQAMGFRVRVSSVGELPDLAKLAAQRRERADREIARTEDRRPESNRPKPRKKRGGW